MSLNGLLNLNKPVGPTSRDVVDLIARPLKRFKVKVGHAGTLDPLASGVLVVAVGSATRLIENVQRLPKTYRTVARLGARSDTLDADGEITETENSPVPSEAQVRAVMSTQVGTILQIPPQFSALRVAGKRAYDLARAGQTVELAARPIRVDRVALLSYLWPHLKLEIDCGSGTYIRSIVRDVGDALGTGALIEVLVRTRIGPFTLDDALDPRALTAESIRSLLRPAIEAVVELPKMVLCSDEAAAIAHGKSLPSRGEWAPGDIALVNQDGVLLALAEFVDGRILPRKVLTESSVE
jgi:tRNA pseudouridine55 synthase